MNEHELAKLKDTYPLPEGTDDMEVSASDLATLFQVSGNTITNWHNHQNMPVKEHGGNGRSYVFQLSDVWAWHQNKENQAVLARKQHVEDLKSARQSLFPDDESFDETVGMSAKERADHYKAVQLYSQTNEFRENYCPKQDVVELIEELMVLYRDTMISLPSLLENDAGATPKQVELATKATDQMIVTMQQNIKKSIIGIDDKEVQKESAA